MTCLLSLSLPAFHLNSPVFASSLCSSLILLFHSILFCYISFIALPLSLPLLFSSLLFHFPLRLLFLFIFHHNFSCFYHNFSCFYRNFSCFYHNFSSFSHNFSSFAQSEKDTGVLVLSTATTAPASSLLKKGDVILSVDSIRVRTFFVIDNFHSFNKRSLKHF